ncbi:hypothetical protein pb186bvf_020634 [Paramecium bursaria]
MSYPNYFEFQEDFGQSDERDKLGQGTYGVVYRIKSKRPIANQPEVQEYAVKFMTAGSEKSFQQIQQEFLILRGLPKNHPNIITLHKTYAWANQQTKTYFLVLAMELADRSLQHEIDIRRKDPNNKQYFNDDELLYIFRQCLEGLNDIMSKSQVFHRDLKPENLLLLKEGLQVKITDFGVSRKLFEEKTQNGTLVGTPAYLSPILWQNFEKGNFNVNQIGKIEHNFEKSDIYSLGITFLQTTLLLKGEVSNCNKGVGGQEKTQELLQQIQNQKIKTIIERMLQHDEKSRATYQELLTYCKENEVYKEKQRIFFQLVQPKSVKEQYKLSVKQSQQLEKQQEEEEGTVIK